MAPSQVSRLVGDGRGKLLSPERRLRAIKKQLVEHLGQLDFLHGRQNVILLGPPGTGKTHLATALGVRACLAGQRVQFATATEWVAKLAQAKRQGQLETELKRLTLI
ncbi:MAG: ATP-binding protein, partial [Solirubrobacteraceae bacterium]